jgi:hypothetical protein
MRLLRQVVVVVTGTELTAMARMMTPVRRTCWSRTACAHRTGARAAARRVPLRPLQLAIGVLLLLFGMRWLRKAILRAAGVIPLHDETIAYAAEMAQLREQERDHKAQLDWFAALASFKAVVLEGLEVVFIVIAVGAGRGLIIPASIGAIAACILVTGVGFQPKTSRSNGTARPRSRNSSSIARSHEYLRIHLSSPSG